MYNLFGWTTSYFLGLQFTHLDKGILTQFIFTCESIKKWGCKLWVLATFLFLALIGIIAYYAHIYTFAGVIYYYIGAVITIALYFAVVTCILRKSHYFHLHRYVIGMLFVELFGGY